MPYHRLFSYNIGVQWQDARFYGLKRTPCLELPRDACLDGVTKGTSLSFAFHSVHAIQSVGLIAIFLNKNSTLQIPFTLKIHEF